ncbi:MAG: ATP-binding cassette domain-containing protein, partial [Pseudomonadota bacterium]|nr:ATP-binding cassette domain-containing protein [Pseudomonadota bacterium]
MSEKRIIEINHLDKYFGDFHVLKNINLSVAAGEKIVICGPSGSGKSTLIRCINHLEKHEGGEIIVDGIPLDDKIKNIDDIRSEVGMVFQQFNLFPHMTVLENCIVAPIWVKGVPRAEAEAHALKY